MRSPQHGIEGALWPRQAIMLAEHLAFVGGAEESAPLQQWNNFGAEGVEHRRQQRRHDIEAVGGIVAEPILDQTSDLFRRAGGGEMAAGAGEACEQFPQRRPLAPHQAQDHFGAAARSLYG